VLGHCTMTTDAWQDARIEVNTARWVEHDEQNGTGAARLARAAADGGRQSLEGRVHRDDRPARAEGGTALSTCPRATGRSVRRILGALTASASPRGVQPVAFHTAAAEPKTPRERAAGDLRRAGDEAGASAEAQMPSEAESSPSASAGCSGVALLRAGLRSQRAAPAPAPARSPAAQATRATVVLRTMTRAARVIVRRIRRARRRGRCAGSGAPHAESEVVGLGGPGGRAARRGRRSASVLCLCRGHRGSQGEQTAESPRGAGSCGGGLRALGRAGQRVGRAPARNRRCCSRRARSGRPARRARRRRSWLGA
jgi:hypothetical protein